jgi:hypothetical protein
MRKESVGDAVYTQYRNEISEAASGIDASNSILRPRRMVSATKMHFMGKGSEKN